MQPLAPEAVLDHNPEPGGHRHAAGLLGGARRPRAQPLLRGAAAAAESTRCSLGIAAASMPDAHGFFSLGTNAEYVAALIGEFSFFLEANRHMPRTFGLNQIHVSQVAGWCEAARPLVEVPPGAPDERDRQIAAAVVEHIPDRATLQVGIGGINDAILGSLTEGSVVTTLNNTVDHVATEWGVAHLRGRSLAERARALIAIAHPDHREALEREARST